MDKNKKKDVIKTVLSKTSKKTVMNSVISFLSTIADNEEVEIEFVKKENTDGLEGKSMLNLSVIKNSQTPNVIQTMDLSNRTAGQINAVIS